MYVTYMEDEWISRELLSHWINSWVANRLLLRISSSEYYIKKNFNPSSELIHNDKVLNHEKKKQQQKLLFRAFWQAAWANVWVRVNERPSPVSLVLVPVNEWIEGQEHIHCTSTKMIFFLVSCCLLLLFGMV